MSVRQVADSYVSRYIGEANRWAYIFPGAVIGSLYVFMRDSLVGILPVPAQFLVAVQSLVFFFLVPFAVHYDRKFIKERVGDAPSVLYYGCAIPPILTLFGTVFYLINRRILLVNGQSAGEELEEERDKSSTKNQD